MAWSAEYSVPLVIMNQFSERQLIRLNLGTFAGILKRGSFLSAEVAGRYG